MLIILSLAIYQSVAEVWLTVVVPLGAVSNRFNLVFLLRILKVFYLDTYQDLSAMKLPAKKRKSNVEGEWINCFNNSSSDPVRL